MQNAGPRRNFNVHPWKTAKLSMKEEDLIYMGKIVKTDKVKGLSSGCGSGASKVQHGAELGFARCHALLYQLRCQDLRGIWSFSWRLYSLKPNSNEVPRSSWLLAPTNTHRRRARIYYTCTLNLVDSASTGKSHAVC